MYRSIINKNIKGYHYIAIYKTKFVCSEVEKFEFDNIQIEITKKKKIFLIPATRRVITTPDEFQKRNPRKDFLKFTLLKIGNNNHNYIYIKLIIKDQSFNRIFSENDMQIRKFEVDRKISKAITFLSLIFDTTSVFSDLVYKGPIIINPQYIDYNYELHLGEYFDFSNKKLKKYYLWMNHNFKYRNELADKIDLMSNFYRRAFELPINYERFMTLWIILEIYPMENGTNIKPIKVILSEILNKSITDIDKYLQVGRIFGIRTDFVHYGKIKVSTIEFLNRINCLFEITTSILRFLLGLPNNGRLDRFFNPNFKYDSRNQMDILIDPDKYPSPKLLFGVGPIKMIISEDYIDIVVEETGQKQYARRIKTIT